MIPQQLNRMLGMRCPVMEISGSKQEDSDSSSNKAKSHKKSDKSGKKEGNVDDADYQGATTTTTTASSDAGMAAAVAVGATTAHASAVE
ncbi:hypothetical protein ES319_D05G093400v1 [Gossypium barbadense]|uniref:Uncharacterized protein n=2 Tax=Gossypium TaxID=3633 RepID=A0A5J5RI42_GOSBA|nr:hypothetical protein ES319_D05G093400v1 [Gossypium barbadense]TYG67733.1 hypothetical protein ES288_D05G098900v1 [Gossypium darwinii]